MIYWEVFVVVSHDRKTLDSRPSNIDLTRILRPTSNGIIGYDF